jgi:hypothetical protein
MKSAFLGLQRNYASFKNLILIIDRIGLIGKFLAYKIPKEYLVVFVSKKNLDPEEENKNIIFVPFFKNNPKIPDGKYSQVIYIDEEYGNLDLLSTLIKKSKNINADFIFAQNLSTEGKYPINKILRTYSSAKIVLFGDVFGDKLIFNKLNSKSTVNMFLFQAQKLGRIQIPGEGIGKTYPVFLDDVVNGLVSLMFEPRKSHFLFYIFPKYPTSELSLVHMIQKANPEIMVDFAKSGSKTKEMIIPPNGFNLLGEKYPLAKKIRDIDIKKTFEVEGKIPSETMSSFKKSSSFIVWTLIILLFLPLISAKLFSVLGKNVFIYAGEEISRGNFVNSQSSLHLSKAIFYLQKQASNVLLFQAKIIKNENFFRNSLEDADVNYKLADSISYMFGSIDYLSKILNDKSEDPEKDLTNSMNALKISAIGLERLRVEKEVSNTALKKIETVIPVLENILDSTYALSDATEVEGKKIKIEKTIVSELQNKILKTIKLII